MLVNLLNFRSAGGLDLQIFSKLTARFFRVDTPSVEARGPRVADDHRLVAIRADGHCLNLFKDAVLAR